MFVDLLAVYMVECCWFGLIVCELWLSACWVLFDLCVCYGLYFGYFVWWIDVIVVVWIGYSAAVCYCLLVVADRLVVCVYG